MKKYPFSVGVISYRKASDAALCSILEKHFQTVTIAQYQIPWTEWINWVYRRIKLMGLWVLLGHILLSVYIRFERTWDKIRGKSLWKLVGMTYPQWRHIESKRIFCFSENQLINSLKNTHIVIALDSFRLSHRFFRQLPLPILQIIWGDVPEYAGDSGGFWAYALGKKEKVKVSIVHRDSQANQLKVIKKILVITDDHETIRTIKVKQVAALQPILVESIIDFINKKNYLAQKTEGGNFFQAPTIWTYWKFFKKRKISTPPDYACHKKINHA